MPSTSKSQQRLMGLAYSVKKGDTNISDVDISYRDTIQELVDGMTLKQLKDFAETKHTGLPDRKNENIQAGSLPGMGNVNLPGNPSSLNSFSTQETGSGDIPNPLSIGSKKIPTFNQFIKNIKNILDSE